MGPSLPSLGQVDSSSAREGKARGTIQELPHRYGWRAGRGRRLIPGAAGFIQRSRNWGRVSGFDQQSALHAAGSGSPAQDYGLNVPRTDFHVRYGHSPLPAVAATRGNCLVIGESGLTEAVHKSGVRITDHRP